MIKSFFVILPFIHEVIFGNKNKNKEPSTLKSKYFKILFYVFILFSLVLNYFSIQRLYKISASVVKMKEQHTFDIQKITALETQQTETTVLIRLLSDVLVLLESRSQQNASSIKNNTESIQRLNDSSTKKLACEK